MKQRARELRPSMVQSKMRILASDGSSMQAPACLRRFVRLCADACAKGWHEANGGNLSYRLMSRDVDEFAPAFDADHAWIDFEEPLPELAGELFLMSAAGAHLANVPFETSAAIGVVEIDASGAAWRVRWGFDGTSPSSEFIAHLAACIEGIQNGDGADRVVYHAHPAQIIALSAVLPADSRRWTRTLWQCLTESIVVFPQGIAAVEWMVPGSEELAAKTRELMRVFKVCVWSHHGIMVRASGFDEAFGMVDTIEKAASIYLTARSACGGNEPVHLVSDEQLRAICARYGLQPNEEFLDSATLKIV